MEDATIEQPEQSESSFYQQGQYPSVINSDDLVFELGKNIVDKLNKEKLLTSLLKKTKIAEEQVTTLRTEFSKIKIKDQDILKELKDLKVSNKLYEENNRKLGDELVIVRQDVNEKQRQINQLTLQIDDISDEKVQSAIKNEQELCLLQEAYKTDILALQTEIKALNTSKKKPVKKTVKR